MLVSDVAKRIDASENTIRKHIKTNKNYFTKKDNILHVTDEGLYSLEEKYKFRAEVLSEDNIQFYKARVMSLEGQVKAQLNQLSIYNRQIDQEVGRVDMYIKQVEQQTDLVELFKKEIESISEEKKNLEIVLTTNQEEINKQKLENERLQKEIETEKNKSLWKRIFNK